MISHRHRYIFIHIPKTGGASVEKLLWPPSSERSVRDLWGGFIDRYHNKYQTGGLLVDFVGRFEAYESSLRRVLSRVAVSTTTVPHEGRGKRGPYREYYDAESMEIVASLYVTDIASFGYSFDGGLGQR